MLSAHVCAQNITSPNGRIKASCAVEDGKPVVTTSVDGTTLVERIQLGLTVNGTDYSTGVTLSEVGDVTTISEEYTAFHGKRLERSKKAEAVSVSLASQTNAGAPELGVELRAYDDGLCFRYVIDNPTGAELAFTGEQTAYTIQPDCKRWLQRFVTSYEGDFPLQDGAAQQAAWNYPMLFQSDDNYLLLTEANSNSEYCSTHTSNETDKNVYAVAYPFAWEGNSVGDVNPVSKATKWTSPWRVLIMGTLGDIVESTLVEDVSDATTMTDTDWIKGGRAAWVYWAYNHGTKDFKICCDYVDLAVKMGWEYVLFDWEWDSMTNGGNLEDAAQYAVSKGVKPLLWYNSGGSHNTVSSTPRDRFLTHESRVKELQWLKSLGFVGVKIDFFESDKQHMMQYYIDILKDCADAQMMVNFHGSTLPRGWSRTYPHLMSMEAVYGAEQYNNSANMTAIGSRINCTLPYTRNVVGPMDYTPVAFTNSQNPHTTSYAHELALSVAFESGIQHWADRPEGFLSLPEEARQHMMNVPAVWDETLFLDGYPGTHFVVARRSGDTWYVAGLNGEKTSRTITVNLEFLSEGEHFMTCYADGAHGAQFSITHRKITSTDEITLQCLSEGGFTLVFSQVPTYDQLQALVQLSETLLSEAETNTGDTPGQYASDKVDALREALTDAQALTAESDAATLANAYIALADAYSDLQTTGVVEANSTKGDAVQPKSGGTDVTAQYLGEAKGFSRCDEPKEINYSRFGLLADPWVVTDNILNKDDGTHGGFDGYNGGRHIGIDKWDDGLPTITNGAIYQVTSTALPAGKYHITLPMTEIWDHLSTGEIVMQVVNGEDFLGGTAIASYDMSQRNNSYNGTPLEACHFELAEPATVSVGWIVNIPAENSRRSMRVTAIHLYQDDTNVSATYLGNYENIQRKDEPNSSIYYRFGTPTHWTVENYSVDNGTNGVKHGIDNFTGYNCLQLGRWEENATAMTAADHTNSRLYKRVTLPEGRYYFGAAYQYMEPNRIGDNAYICVLSTPVNSADVPEQAMAYATMKSSALGSTFYGVEFSIDTEQEVILGWQMDSNPQHSEFRASEVRLIHYPTNINTAVTHPDADNKGKPDFRSPAQYYSITGVQLNAAPRKGLFIMRQGGNTFKIYKK